MSAKDQFVATHASQYPVALLCRVLGVARSGSSAWRTRTESRRSHQNRTLTDHMRTIHQASGGTYGSPRVHAELRAQGRCSSQKRVARLMRLNGVVGRSMQATLSSALVVAALQLALHQRGRCTALLDHSDRGSQYASQVYQAQLAGAGIQASMSRTGNCWDNAVVERFVGTLKTELVEGQGYRSRAEAHHAIFEYIEVFYNRRRRHSTLGYVSPAHYEAEYRTMHGSAQGA